jgi:hypothetical protein
MAFGAVFERDLGALDEVVAAQCSDASSKLAPVPERADAKVLEILRRQVASLPVIGVPIRAEPSARCDRTRHWIKNTRTIFV